MIRKELKEDKGNIRQVFPMTEKIDLESAQFTPVSSHQVSGENQNHLKPSTPSSMLAKSFTSTDFNSKTILDKKCFALANNQKCPSGGGLKDILFQ